MFSDDCEGCKRNEEELSKKPGPWTGEPHRVEFEHAGLPCILHRGPIGAWCGYVGLPESHPAYNKPYDDVDVEVHGGLTYGEMCEGHICHVDPKNPDDKRYWLGFDCAHYLDVRPRLQGFSDGVYRDMAYVRKETESLAEQLSKLKQL